MSLDGRSMRLAAFGVVVCLVVPACGGEAPSVLPGIETPTASASERPDPSAVAQAAAFGRWRSAAIIPEPAFQASIVQACRTEAAVGDLPLAVFDARGEGIGTAVFARDAEAVLCRAVATVGGSVTTEAGPIQAAADPLLPEVGRLGAHEILLVDAGTASRKVLVGRVGDRVFKVEVSFDPELWARASKDQGWYAIWWPAALNAIAVASSDTRSLVIDSFPP